MISVVTAGCLNKPPLPGDDPGTLRVSLIFPNSEGESGRVLQSVQGAMTYNDDSKTIVSETEYNGPNTSLLFRDLFAGKWRLTVSVTDEAGDGILTGETKVEIFPGKDSSITVTLTLAQATLDIAMDASQIPGLGSTITKGRVGIYYDPSSNRATYKDLGLQGTTLAAVIPNLPEGDFTARICVPNATSPVFASERFPLQLRAGKTTVVRMDATGKIVP